MQKNKKTSFIFIVCALVIGSALYRLFDPSTSKFEKPALATLYSIALLFNIVCIIRNFRYNKNLKE
ncbi:hypothetical protein HX017_17255 [Myroides marinus]|uniref:ATP synthase F0 sector subunit C n=1 Tax=Myroides marinus TaxID=703342 RepID=A0A1H6U198_9FLAO|nr:hypothetical protein [Myroides marinus]MDM1348672.1 hypothetical protein [Myroides marinus]MDM1351988.1 hypothetical protein [Myroides marinus]MDM1355840.1 hypothetical protein [Myroides marinus]MDM1359184.1 hypothetical protein [Myroides marinus]MDM1362641.1 hypothetical protein [Myroides marinus]